MKKFFLGLGALVVLGAGCSSATYTNTPTGTTTNTGNTGTTKTYTMAQVNAANTPSNCLSVINGKVYNLTAWISQHPGGDKAILSICGTDGSAAFNNQHGGQMRPESVLAGFQVGVLK